MKCDRCDNEATIHLTQVVEGQVRKVHLCETCAAAEGLDINQTISITDLLLGKSEDVEPEILMESDQSCPRCHFTRADFKKTGRLGCPSCYEHFSEGLAPLLKAVQRGNRHRGKIPSREGLRVQKAAELGTLHEELAQAVAEERYEDAARVRDQIKVCQEALETQPGD